MTAAGGRVGTVNALWRYPVKSMLGHLVESSDLGVRGLSGDRAFAIVDSETGKIVSAKNPRRWPAMFQFSARYLGSQNGDAAAVEITLPDGSTTSSDNADSDRRLSDALGRDVRLTNVAPEKPGLEEYWPDMGGLEHRETVTDERIGRAAPGTFFDFSPLHIVTTSSLARFSELYPEGRFDVRRFRPNIVVDTPKEGFVENEWVGQVLEIGDAIRLKVVIPMPRCVMTTLPQAELPADSGILRTVAEHNRPTIPGLDKPMASVGIAATVISGGSIQAGDEVRLAV